MLPELTRLLSTNVKSKGPSQPLLEESKEDCVFIFNVMGRRPALRTELLYRKKSVMSALLGVA
jgi:hypothetical protein